ncbi:MAG: nitroreductase family protein [Proteobacteria bacterium]|nr:nitroreductase family protein [Pseudomonadota bacterium]MBU1742348.1 nitroreductase family protein [Pseudomonadota bacterium]
MAAVFETIIARRTVRAFGPEPVTSDHLTKLVEAARVAPSAANKQPLAYIGVNDPDLLPRIFDCLKWAAYIAPAGDPPPGQEPRGYIVVLKDKKVADETFFRYDVGAAVENMLLAAQEMGLASCWIASVNRPRVRDILDVPEDYDIDCVIALGKPAEHPVMVEMQGDDVRYWRDEAGVHHVPKRPLSKIFRLNSP